MGGSMTEGIGGAALSQSYELLGVALAKSQQVQEGKMTLQLLQSAISSAPTATAPSAVGNLGQNINLHV
ncbi:hypothetical protein [Rheinheimera sp.]|uniref:hypothetical protein n=1 Tax=Rheinheimera sp. TaxID=1869214 RepID=UPI0027B8DE27|nr:hypothetical protein [Rheinheimera sp.]